MRHKWQLSFLDILFFNMWDPLILDTMPKDKPLDDEYTFILAIADMKYHLGL